MFNKLKEPLKFMFNKLGDKLLFFILML